MVQLLTGYCWGMSTASGDEYLVTDATLAVPEERPVAVGHRWPFALVAVIVAAGLLMVTFGGFTAGVQILAAGMAAAAVLRLVTPTSYAGWLANRSRLVDVTCFAGLAVALAATVALVG